MAKRPSSRTKGGSKKYGLTSKILDTIRSEVQNLGVLEGSDYYAKQANPKDGGYAKSNYVTGDGYAKDAGSWNIFNEGIQEIIGDERTAALQVAGATEMRVAVKTGVLRSGVAKARAAAAKTGGKSKAKAKKKK
jgi:hypothetical protein